MALPAEVKHSPRVRISPWTSYRSPNGDLKRLTAACPHTPIPFCSLSFQIGKGKNKDQSRFWLAAFRMISLQGNYFLLCWEKKAATHSVLEDVHVLRKLFLLLKRNPTETAILLPVYQFSSVCLTVHWFADSI